LAIAYSGLIKVGWEEVDITHTVCDICLKTKLCKLFEKTESSVLCIKANYLAVCEDCFIEEFHTGFTKFPCPKCGEYFEPYNVRVKLNSRYYWLDFYIPRERLVIEVSPKIWHKMWNRQESDKTKYQTLRRNGLRVVEVHDKNYKEVLEYNLQHLIKE